MLGLRDREGLTQVVFEPDIAKEAHELAGQLRLEYCIGIKGKVASRGAQVNPKLKTGEIEIKASDLTIFNRSEPTPFPIEDNIDTYCLDALNDGSFAAFGTSDGRVYGSIDQGATWDERASGLEPVRRVLVLQ